jgi:hypothetical protein
VPQPSRAQIVKESLTKIVAETEAKWELESIEGFDRHSWSRSALRILTHETEHALFKKSPTETRMMANPCDFKAIERELTEIAAIISEFRPVHHKALGLTGAARDRDLRSWLEWWIRDSEENIQDNVKFIRCARDCDPANDYIRRMFEFASKDWTT